MSRVTTPSIADSYDVISKIAEEKKVCCKVCTERRVEHDSYTATKRLLMKN